MLFAEFLKAYTAEVEALSGLTNLTRLLDATTAACIHEVSEGVLGAACNLIKATVCGAVADGRSYLSSDDFARATDRYVVAMGLHARNPFRRGAPTPLVHAA